MGRKLTYDQVRKAFKDGGCELLSEQYANSVTKLNYKCSCGGISYISYNSFQQGHRCRKCGCLKNKISRLKPYKDVSNIFRDNGCTLLSTEYKGSSDKLDYICNCGNKSQIKLHNFLMGHRCSKCKIEKNKLSQKFSYEQVKKIFRDENCTLLSKDYINNAVKLKYICSCGSASKIRLSDFSQGRRCSKCGIDRIKEKLKFSYDKVKKIFKDEDCELLSHEYKNSSTKLKYRCSCGNTSKIALCAFSRGSRCRKCWIEKISGVNNYNYNPDLTDVEREANKTRTSDPLYIGWRKDVFISGGYVCCRCYQRGGALNAHHILNYSTHKEIRLNVNNGIVLCRECHKEFHRVYGRKNNNMKQIEEFLKSGSLCQK